MPHFPRRQVDSLFQDALWRREATPVYQNRVKSVEFTRGNRANAIGTNDLNGGIVVAMVSNWAAVLAHIPPLPYQTRDPGAGLNNLRARMGDFINEYYRVYRHLPRDYSRTYVVVPVYQGRLALPDHKDAIVADLSRNGLPRPRVVYYEVRASGRGNAAKGSVFIDARNRRQADVYVEDQRV